MKPSRSRPYPSRQTSHKNVQAMLRLLQRDDDDVRQEVVPVTNIFQLMNNNDNSAGNGCSMNTSFEFNGVWDNNSSFDDNDDAAEEAESDSDEDGFLIDDHVDRVSSISSDDECCSDTSKDDDPIFKHQDIISAMYTSASIVFKVAAIALFFKLPMTAVNAILALLRFLNHYVPKDARTVFKTPRSGPISTDFEHIGLKNQLIKKMKTSKSHINTREILLDVNIDGIPLFKSSNITSWPILISICNFSDKRPFPVSIFCGSGKPENLNSYLKPFVEEMLELEREGLLVDEVHFSVKIRAIICDAPARSFIKSIIGHGGKKGCERCDVVGNTVHGRTTFKTKASTRARTNESFRLKKDSLHHKSTTPLLALNIDMIKSFPLDYMHLVCLGVVKRLLKIWINGKGIDIRHKLSVEDINNINQKIFDCSKHFPSEFNRKGRDILEFSRWKAVECRSFLLYSGVKILKGVLSEDKYHHFLLLHVAMRILLAPNSTVAQIEYAGRCLSNFVSIFETIYGTHHLVYNVHNLLHLADDCIYFKGSLDQFSCFPFENYLGQMKQLLRGTRKVLAQLVRRLVEIEKHDSLSWLLPRKIKKQFNIKLNADCFFCLENGLIVKLVKIVDNNSFLAHPLLINDECVDFYKEPLNSSLLGIKVCTGFNENLFNYPIHLLNNGTKCIFFPFEKEDNDVDPEISFVIFPLLHQRL